MNIIRDLNLSDIEIQKAIFMEKEKKILIIGPPQKLKCHVSENLHDEFKKLGVDIKYFDPSKLQLTRKQLAHQEPYYLKTLLRKLSPWIPDFIFIDECGILFINDQNIPVIYHHREFKRIPQVNHPDAVLFWHEEIQKWFKNKFTP
ncbi:MAG: hypothetical protein ACTSRZ_19590, partial [Promethearchaeota archaeon]